MECLEELINSIIGMCFIYYLMGQVTKFKVAQEQEQEQETSSFMKFYAKMQELMDYLS